MGDASSCADRWQKAVLGSVMPDVPCRSRGAGTIVPIFRANKPKRMRLSHLVKVILLTNDLSLPAHQTTAS